MKKKNKRQQDELDVSNLNETVEETERRSDAESNLAKLRDRGPASPNFDAPFAPGLGSAGATPNSEDEFNTDLGDGSQIAESDLNDVSGNPEVYNRRRKAEDISDEGGMTLDTTNEADEEVEERRASQKPLKIKKGTVLKTSEIKPVKPVTTSPVRIAAKKKAAPKKKTTKKKTTKKAAKKSPARKKSAPKKKSPARKAKRASAKKKSPAKKSTKKSTKRTTRRK